MKRCLFLRAIGKNVLLSIYSFRVIPMAYKFNSGSKIFQFGWFSLYYRKKKEAVE